MLTVKIQPSSMVEPHICSCEILIWQSNSSITLICTISVLSTMQQLWQTRQTCPQPVAQELFLFSSPSAHSCPNLICKYFRLFMKCCIAWYRVQYPALKSKMQLLPQQHCPWRYTWGAGNETHSDSDGRIWALLPGGGSSSMPEAGWYWASQWHWSTVNFNSVSIYTLLSLAIWVFETGITQKNKVLAEQILHSTSTQYTWMSA